MPWRANGFGVWYYGKTNRFAYTGTCDQCGAMARLSSYDTTRYLTAFFVPLIPFGKRRVINQCSQCTAHLSLPLHKWEQLKDEAYVEAWEAYEKDPANPEAARKLARTFATFQDREGFLGVAGEIAEKHRGDPQTLQVIAEVYGEFGCLNEAEDTLRLALGLKDDDEIRERLAFSLMMQHRPDDAAPLLGHILERKEADKIEYPLMLADCYQAVGNHEKALETLTRSAEIAPTLAQDKTFVKSVKTSRKNLHTGKPIRGKSFQSFSVEVDEGTGIGPRVARMAGPAVFFVILGALAVASYFVGQSRRVHLVNGLLTPYTVTLAGEEHYLPAMGNKTVRIAEAKYTLTVQGDGVYVPPRTIEIRTPFLSRPFVGRTFVINPDSVAPVVWEKVIYGNPDEWTPEGDSEIHIGEALYTFGSVDHPFENIPEEVNLGRKGWSSRTRLILLTSLGFDRFRLAHYLEDSSSDKLDHFLVTHVLSEPDQTFFGNQLIELLGAERAVEVTKPLLDEKPIVVPWQRLYQNAMERMDPDHDLAAEYRARLESDPENASLQYLLGRVVRDPSEAAALFQQAITGDPPCQLAYAALTYQKLALGRYDEALDIVRRAESEHAEIEGFEYLAAEVYEAAGDYEHALEICKKLRTEAPREFSRVVSEVYMIALAVSSASAEETAERWLDMAAKMLYPPDVIAVFRARLEALIAYATQDMETFVELVRETDMAWNTLVAAVIDGDIGEVEQAWKTLVEEEGEEVEADDHLIVYLAAKRAGRGALARDALQAAAEKLREGFSETREYAAYLTGAGELDVDRALTMSVLPREKALILAALAQVYPEQKEPLIHLARKLNYSRVFPHWEMEGFLSSEGKI